MKKIRFLRKILWMSIGVYLIWYMPFFAQLKSLIIMIPYSIEQHSQIKSLNEAIKVQIPGGYTTLRKDWYPVVLIFNGSEGISNRLNKDIELEIYYNFASFEPLMGSSQIFDENSKRYSSFYGAYIIRRKNVNKPFGINMKGEVNQQELLDLMSYDYGELVLKSIGCEHPSFVLDEFQSENLNGIKKNEHIIKVDGLLKANGMAHNFKNSYRAYFQYGENQWGSQQDFEVINFYTRCYIQYMPEKNITVIFYALSPNSSEIDYIDQNFLRKSKISLR